MKLITLQNKELEAGQHTLELAAILPLMLGLCFGLFDIARIILTYGQLRTTAETALEQAAGIRSQQIQHAPEPMRFRWVRHRYEGGAVRTVALPGLSAAAPAECFADERTSCSALPGPPQQGQTDSETEQQIAMRIAKHLEKDPRLQTLVPGHAPHCSLEKDADCLAYSVTVEEHTGTIHLQIEATISLLALGRMLEAFTDREFVRLSTNSTIHFESALSSSSPLVLNQD